MNFKKVLANSLILAFLIVSMASIGFGESLEKNHIVLFKDNASQEVLESYGTIEYKFTIINAAIIKLTETEAQQIRLLPLVKSVEEDKEIEIGPVSEEPQTTEPLSILTPQSLPEVGGTWDISFQTTGTANFSIEATDGTTWSNSNENNNLKMLQISCNGQARPYSWTDNKASITNYTCNGTSTLTNKVLTEGKHTIKVAFGDTIRYAYNDTNQWNLDENGINAINAWNDYNVQGNGVKIAIIDSGVNYNLPALSGAKYLGGKDFCVTGTKMDCLGEDDYPMDEYGHGTQMATAMLASSDTLKGIAPAAQYYALKITNDGNYSHILTLMKAFEWVVLQGDVSIVYMGVKSASLAAFTQELDSNYSKGMIFVAPTYKSSYFFPAAYPQVIGVGGHTKDVPQIITSDTGLNPGDPMKDPELLGPGEKVLTFDINGQVIFADDNVGVAAAQVAGALALMIDYNRTNLMDYNNVGLRQILDSNAVHLDGVPNANQGYGKANVFAAIQAMIGEPKCMVDADCKPTGNQCTENKCIQYKCVETPKPDSTSCEADEDLCTIDHCDGAGECVWKENVFVPEPEQCNSFYCDPADGQVKEDYSNYQLSTPCENGIYCDGTDQCNGVGECVPLGPPIDCSGLSNQCNNGVCDEEQDNCIKQALPNGTACDELFCNVEEVCIDGTCSNGSAKDCSSFNISGIATCNWNPDDLWWTWDYRLEFISGCNEQVDACTQGNKTISHTVDEKCAKCMVDADCPAIGNQCTENKCIEYSCVETPKPLSTSCNNSLYCDGLDQCDGTGKCVPSGLPIDCSSQNDQCNNGICDESQDSCIKQALPDGTTCDELFCKVGEVCIAGTCTSDTAKDCSSSDIFGIATCDWSPDDLWSTWDYRQAFTSTCDEQSDTCTKGNETITHTVDKKCTDLFKLNCPTGAVSPNYVFSLTRPQNLDRVFLQFGTSQLFARNTFFRVRVEGKQSAVEGYFSRLVNSEKRAEKGVLYARLYALTESGSELYSNVCSFELEQPQQTKLECPIGPVSESYAFDWNVGSYGSGNRLQLSDNESFERAISIIARTSPTPIASRYSWLVRIDEGNEGIGVFYARMRSEDQYGRTAYSNVCSFSLRQPVQPALLWCPEEPINESYKFTWTRGDLTGRATIQFSYNQLFEPRASIIAVTSPTPIAEKYRTLVKYEENSVGGKLYARIAGRDKFGRQLQSNVCEFTLVQPVVQVLECPTAPVNENYAFAWNAGGFTNDKQMQFSYADGFGEMVKIADSESPTPIATRYKMLKKYQTQSSSGKLYARLFGKDNYGRQNYSNVCEFELS